MPTRWHPTEAGPHLGQREGSFPLPVGADKAGTLAIPEMPAGMARSSQNRSGARRDPGADVPGAGGQAVPLAQEQEGGCRGPPRPSQDAGAGGLSIALA